MFILKAPGRDSMDGAELVERPHFSNTAFYMELFKRKPYQASLPSWCHPSSKGNSIALGSWWFMGWMATGRLLFVLQPVFINGQQPTGWSWEQQALCLILLTQALSAASSRPTECRWPRGQMKNLDHSELRVRVSKAELLCPTKVNLCLLHKAALSICQTTFNTSVRMILWRRECQPNAVFLPGKSRGQRRLSGYCPWGCKELDMIERLTLSLSDLIWSMLWSWERDIAILTSQRRCWSWEVVPDLVPRLRRPRQALLS